MILIVRCPRCGRVQLFIPRTRDYNKWVKRCVYCGYSFKVNPKSRNSSEIIIFVTNDIKQAQEYIKKLKS